MPLRVLIIGLVWPEPTSSAAGSRMMQLIGFFLEKGYKVTFACSANDSPYASDLLMLGVDKVSIELNNSTFDDFVGELQPDIVMYDRYMIEEQFGWRVREVCPKAVQILDTEDLHCLRKTREQSHKKGNSFDNRQLMQSEVAKREIASILRCDLSIMISAYEIDLLTTQFKIDPSLLIHIPFMIDAMDQKETDGWTKFEERAHFVSIGNFRHPPNKDAVLYLKKEIWPLIRQQLPKTELHVYGAYVTSDMEALDAPNEGFLVKGRADDALQVIGASRVLLAPLRFGAGLKGKLLEAMQVGTPSITTSIGAESMSGDYPWPGSIANSVEEIVSSAIELYSEKSIWIERQAVGVQIVNQLYSKELLNNKLSKKLSEIKSHLEEHRSNNFIGSMLQHHSLASTKYMSKWIEEKNKRAT